MSLSRLPLTVWLSLLQSPQTFRQHKVVVFTDLTGFSLLSDSQALLAVFGSLVCLLPFVQNVHGLFVKDIGDSFMIVFDTFDQALEAMKNHQSQALHWHPPLSCGIAEGDILCLPNGEYYGSAVNEASRLGEDISQGDEICLSSSISLPPTIRNHCVEKYAEHQHLLYFVYLPSGKDRSSCPNHS